MSETKNNRTKHIHVRFTNNEYEKIAGQFGSSTCRKISEYVRKVLLDKPIKVNHRNQSLDDFMAELIALRTELNAIGNNYNQVVKKLHMMQEFEGMEMWLVLNETAKKNMADQVAAIKSKINQINDQWLR